MTDAEGNVSGKVLSSDGNVTTLREWVMYQKVWHQTKEYPVRNRQVIIFKIIDNINSIAFMHCQP